MKLAELLAERKEAVLHGWLREIVATYPAESARFFLNLQDPFANPIGHIVWESIAILFAELVAGKPTERTLAALEQIIKIRAVQDLSPSQALAIFFRLKAVLRQALAKELAGPDLLAELAELEARIDDLGLAAFDIFMGCRERIYDMKTRAARREMHLLLRRAKLVTELPDQPTDEQDANIISLHGAR
ncbi:MAG: RsbRD N-terminal domain-containing protein [Thermodesulfobacteriota bacterium]